MTKGKTKRQLDEEARQNLPQTTHEVVSTLYHDRILILMILLSFAISAHEATKQRALVRSDMPAIIVGGRRRVARMEVCLMSSAAGLQH